MTAHDSLLNRAIQAVKAGDVHMARRLLSEVLRQDPGSEMGWIWLSATLDTTQGRAYCLRMVLALNPSNMAAQRGLARLAQDPRAPAMIAGSPPDVVVPATPPRQPLAPDSPARLEGHAQAVLVQPRTPPVAEPSLTERPPVPEDRVQGRRFWQIVVACLGAIALVLVGILLYAMLGSGNTVDEDALAMAAALPSYTPGPVGTLRPTFTLAPTDAPPPTQMPLPTDISVPTPTSTPAPSSTSTPSPTPTRPPRRRRPTQTPAPTPRPQATLPPRVLDPRLAHMGVRVEPAFVGAGQPYWRLIEARWTDEQESGGKHSVFVEVLNAHGARKTGQLVVFQWQDGSVTLPTEDPPAPDWPVNFAMYNTLGSYSVYVSGAPSDRVVGLGLGTAEAPHFTIHTCFYLTFRLVYR